MKQILNDSIITDNFSKSYPFINRYLYTNGDLEDSRNGMTKEILDFKTKITNPYKRCVGNNKRNMNIFFLLAEAIWIFKGEKDVEFLNIFNSRMIDYSDDGINFHAPYGFRMRNWGVSSFDKKSAKISEGQNHYMNQLLSGEDQILENLHLLNSDSGTRRAVISIWNPDLDLNKNSKDLPCNDLVFLKIRNNKLITTISNRSNDLHWGLPTNVFQFSFVTEIISEILGIELGTQTHNSNSLHFYLENEIATDLELSLTVNNGDFQDIYDFSNYLKMNINFKSHGVSSRLNEVDLYLSMIINSIKSNIKLNEDELNHLKEFSSYFYLTYKLLSFYVDYKNHKGKTDNLRLEMIEKIKTELYEEYKDIDIFILALNFFASRISPENRTDKSILGNL